MLSYESYHQRRIQLSIHALYRCPTCTGRFAFPEQHWPHCPGHPKNLTGETKKAIEIKFTKPELAKIAAHGPQRDERIGRRGAKR